MLTERQRMILNAIVDDYIRSAEPVGSRSISKRGDVGYSAATIRNEMADLEELGFLEQPHTSAGRVPSIKGYRYYVDHLVKLGDVNEHELKLLRSYIAEKMRGMEQVTQHAAMILSNLTNYTSIFLGPETFNTTLKHFQLVPLNEDTAVAIIVTSTGHVENTTVSIPSDMSMSDMERIVNILNAKLAGVPLVQLRSKLFSEVGEELSRYAAHCERMIDVLTGVLKEGEGNRVFLSGTTNILTQPEFKDVDKVKTLLDLLEETPTIMKLFADLPAGIQVRIGTENEHEAINNCSLITATFSIDGQSLGTIGILGPTRMEYGKVISLLDVLSKDLAVLMARWYK
ncbi:heat-inducible transcriptional repressor HrcA [Paenibacillus cisolokensis]|jgi:heat shock gene repressor HrcA|uniref:Heat-inducible transcription repressor HrcA n=1 Tax=Paenibacillus cisolokensis TaxID=1658519 RepID=A0ABQ4N270_9BACL|nr:MULTISPECIES: heat-inducible transcriptional repressor HrcA [Paenibacillus]ALS27270.1 HrcA family transcriptional regulator [Paenibacillus sp. 32O-W]GIQ62270.1 heat-inducible transcription repressor HrcA [Paenibacillus cisolokensis]